MPAGPHSCVGGIHADLGRGQCACFRSWRRRGSSCHRNDSGTMVPAGCGARSCARWWQSQRCRLRRPVATKRPSAHLSTRSPADVPATIGLCHDQDTWPRFQRGGRRSRRTGLPKECCAQPRAGAGRGSDGLDGLLVHAPGLRGGGLSADVQRHQGAALLIPVFLIGFPFWTCPASPPWRRSALPCSSRHRASGWALPAICACGCWTRRPPARSSP